MLGYLIYICLVNFYFFFFQKNYSSCQGAVGVGLLIRQRWARNYDYLSISGWTVMLPQAAVQWSLSGVVVSTRPDKTKQRVSISRKTSQKWQETGLEAGLEIRLYVSWVQATSYKSMLEGRTVGSRTCVLTASLGKVRVLRP